MESDTERVGQLVGAHPWRDDGHLAICDMCWLCSRVETLQARVAALEALERAAVAWRDARQADIAYRARGVVGVDTADAYHARTTLKERRDAAHERFWALVDALQAARDGEG